MNKIEVIAKLIAEEVRASLQGRHPSGLTIEVVE